MVPLRWLLHHSPGARRSLVFIDGANQTLNKTLQILFLSLLSNQPPPHLQKDPVAGEERNWGEQEKTEEEAAEKGGGGGGEAAEEETEEEQESEAEEKGRATEEEQPPWRRYRWATGPSHSVFCTEAGVDVDRQPGSQRFSAAASSR